MRQLVYISTAASAAVPGRDAAAILGTSRRNNAQDEISGLLYFDGKRFLQVLEGEPAAVDRAFARIGADARHRAIVVLSDRTVTTREFGAWAMAYRAPGDDAARFLARVGELAAAASPGVRATFTGFAEVRRAA